MYRFDDCAFGADPVGDAAGMAGRQLLHLAIDGAQCMLPDGKVIGCHDDQHGESNDKNADRDQARAQ